MCPLAAIAEVYKNEGNDAFKKEEFSDAIAFYSEGVKVNCRDDELNAKLYNNRSMANFYSGKIMFQYSRGNLCTTATFGQRGSDRYGEVGV